MLWLEVATSFLNNRIHGYVCTCTCIVFHTADLINSIRSLFNDQNSFNSTLSFEEEESLFQLIVYFHEMISHGFNIQTPVIIIDGPMVPIGNYFFNYFF